MPDNVRKAAEMAAREVISALGDPVKHEAAVANIATFFESYAQSFLQASATRPAADADGQSEAVLREALKPFAAFADPAKRVPRDLVITSGSRLARRQLTMGDCYDAADALTSPARARGEG